MDANESKRFVQQQWDESIVPKLQEFIRIPNKSPLFDPQWAEHGYMDQAVELAEQWCREQPIPGMKIETVRLPGRTPLLYIDVPGTAPGCVLLYGHLDKQPEFTGWASDLGPWKPVIRNGKLYGRGGADDGYAVFSSLAAIRALHEQGIGHARCVLVIECCEESGSYDLPAYIDHLADRIGTPDLVVCLDAECGNYEQFWCTTSLRGNLVGTLRVDVLEEGVHSGGASGIAPPSFRILRQVLDRVEDPRTGELKVPELHVDIPEARRDQNRRAGEVLGKTVYEKFPYAEPGMQPETDDPAELLLNNTWRPTMVVTGAEGLPDFANAGNVLRPYTAVKLSFRLPPTCDAHAAAQAVKKTLESDPPHGARVKFDTGSAMAGWEAPPVADWLHEAMDNASQRYFGKEAMYMGTGGSIPFMGLLAERFPQSQFLVTGVLGPKSNAHGPNEFLHIETGKNVTLCVAEVLEAHASQARPSRAAA